MRIHSIPYENGYVLVSQWGRLRDLYLHEDLNKESEETQTALGAEIPYGHPDIDGGVLPLVKLTKAVQGYMGRGTVALGQKNGRKRARMPHPVPFLKRVRQYRPRGPRRPQLSLEELGLLDPVLTDAAQEEGEAAQDGAARIRAAAAKSLRKPGWDYVPQESSDNEFEQPKLINARTRARSRASTEPL